MKGLGGAGTVARRASGAWQSVGSCWGSGFNLPSHWEYGILRTWRQTVLPSCANQAKFPHMIRYIVLFLLTMATLAYSKQMRWDEPDEKLLEDCNLYCASGVCKVDSDCLIFLCDEGGDSTPVSTVYYVFVKNETGWHMCAEVFNDGKDAEAWENEDEYTRNNSFVREEATILKLTFRWKNGNKKVVVKVDLTRDLSYGFSGKKKKLEPLYEMEDEDE